MIALAAFCVAAAAAASPVDSPTLAQAFAASQPDSPAGAPGSSTEPDWWTQDDWSWVDHAPAPLHEEGRKSPWAAVGASALLPGLGERYVGHPRRAKFFWAAETAIWSTFLAYRIQGVTRRDRFVEFAERQAGAPSDADADYYEHIGFWQSLEEWHDIVRRDARFVHPDDPAAQAEYFEVHKRYDAAEAWSWDDDDARQRYRVLRSKSERAYRNARLAVGAALLNRFASIVDAFALTRRTNRALEREGARLELRIAPESTADGFVVGPILTAEY